MIKILEVSDRYIRFEISNINHGIANMLRRTLINDIPKLAIYHVKFHHGRLQDEAKNSYDSITPLFDEILALRLGLVPLPTDLNMNFRVQCTHPQDQSCPSCTVLYMLNKFGPCTVYSEDLMPVGSAKDFATVEKRIPLVKLKEKQAILVEAEAILGTAKDHAKWQVTSGVSYKHHREYNVPKGSELAKKLKEQCKNCLISETHEFLVVTDDNPCILKGELLSDHTIEYTEDDSRFIFQFETDGSLKAIETLNYAITKLRNRLENIKNTISG